MDVLRFIRSTGGDCDIENENTPVEATPVTDGRNDHRITCMSDRDYFSKKPTEQSNACKADATQWGIKVASDIVDDIFSPFPKAADCIPCSKVGSFFDCTYFLPVVWYACWFGTDGVLGART